MGEPGATRYGDDHPRPWMDGGEGPNVNYRQGQKESRILEWATPRMSMAMSTQSSKAEKTPFHTAAAKRCRPPADTTSPTIQRWSRHVGPHCAGDEHEHDGPGRGGTRELRAKQGVPLTSMGSVKGRTPSPSMILSCRQKDGTQPSIDLGRLNPLGALSQHRGANSQRRWMLSRTRCPFSLLDQPIQGAGTPIDGPRSTW